MRANLTSLGSSLGLALLASLLLAESFAKESPDTTQSPAKDKKSAEDIMFGNQQNKPAGMVDDLLTLPEERNAHKEKSNMLAHPAANVNKTNAASTTNNIDKRERGDESAKSAKDKSSSNKESDQAGSSGSSLDSQKFDYYDYLQETDDSRLPYPPSVEGYHLESIEERNGKAPATDSSQTLPADAQTYNQRELGDYPEEDYDGVLYRRKRTPRRTPRAGSSSLARERSVRSNLDDLLAGGGAGRRALRLKRDVGVERFLAWLATLSRQPQQLRLREDDPPPIEMEMAENDEAPSEIPLSFFYDPKMAGNDGDEWYNPIPRAEELEEPVFPPGFLESALTPAVTRQLMEEEARMPRDPVIPDWMNARYPPYPVLSRRSPASDLTPSSPKSQASSYPLDYRYVSVPGQKKKRQGHRVRTGGIHVQDLHESSAEKGKWGQFPTAHRRRSEDPDPETLYALASLLAEDAPNTRNNADDDDELDRRRRRAIKP